jgi:hypothetical protein
VWTEKLIHLVEGVLAELSSRLLSWDVNAEKCTLQVYNAAISGNLLPTFRATQKNAVLNCFAAEAVVDVWYAAAYAPTYQTVIHTE